jgi:Spy/CpxP family protein refolding chaperone
MNTLAKYRAIMWLILLFAGGAVFGYYLSTCVARPRTGWYAGGANPEKGWRERRVENLRKALNLTDEQVGRMAPSFDQAERELRQLRVETAARTREIVASNSKGLWQLLTPEQQEKFKQWIKEKSASTNALGRARQP